MKKININRTEFLRLLSDGGVFAGRNRAITALNNVRIMTHNGRVRVESSNSDNYIKIYGSCLDGTEDVSFCVNPKELTSYLNLITDEVINIGVDEEKSMMKLKHSHGTMKTPIFDAKEFPTKPVSEESESCSLPAQRLADWLNTARQFVVDKNIGTSLGGVNLRVVDNKLIIVGADHGLIYMSDCKLEQTMNFNIIIPREGAKVLATMCGGTDVVDLSVVENALIVKNFDFMLVINLVDVRYPDLHRLVTHKGEKTVSVDAMTFKQAARRISAQADVSEHRIKAAFKSGEITLSYDCPQVGKHVEEIIPCECPDFDVPVTISIDYLLMALNSITGDKVVFYHSDNERSPFFFECVGENYSTVILLGTMA